MEAEIIAAFIGVAGVVLGSVISYRLGKRQGVDQHLRARRVEVTMTIRKTVHEITAGFERMAAWWDRLGYPDLLDEDPKISIYRQIYSQVAPKIRELEHYYASNEPWLTEDAKRILEPCIADGRDLADSLDRRRSTDDWSDELTDAIVRAGALRFRNHLDILDRYVSSVLGTQRPWWRRMFGA